ncbi:hypothetical protein EON63_21635, partial [archaeon]
MILSVCEYVYVLHQTKLQTTILISLTGHMMGQQLLILRAASISITALFFAACVLSWANYPYGIAAITTVVYGVSYYYLVREGYRAYRIFVPNE